MAKSDEERLAELEERRRQANARYSQQIARVRRSISEKRRKARNHMLIEVGAAVTSALGGESGEDALYDQGARSALSAWCRDHAAELVPLLGIGREPDGEAGTAQEMQREPETAGNDQEMHQWHQEWANQEPSPWSGE